MPTTTYHISDEPLAGQPGETPAEQAPPPAKAKPKKTAAKRKAKAKKTATQPAPLEISLESVPDLDALYAHELPMLEELFNWTDLTVIERAFNPKHGQQRDAEGIPITSGRVLSAVAFILAKRDHPEIEFATTRILIAEQAATPKKAQKKRPAAKRKPVRKQT